jgi:putative ABC transport system permease protein
LTDLRFCLRAVRGSPVFSLVAILTLGIAIGFTSAMYGFVRGILLAPLPYLHPDELVVVSSANATEGFSGLQISAADLLALREKSRSFDAISGLDYRDVNLSGESGPERVTAGEVVSDLLPLLGMGPALGRGFSASEAEAVGETILSDRLWRSRFGGAPDALGRTLRVDGASFTIVGVLPPGAEIPLRSADLFLLTPESRLRLGEDSAPSLQSFARLRGGVSLSAARDEVEAISRRMEQERPPPPVTGWRLRVTSLRQEVVGDVESTLWILQAAVALALLVSCANFSGLLVARGTLREREIAVRRALGADRLRIVRLLVTESVVLSLGGGAVGLVLSRWATSVFLALAPEEIPRTSEVAADGPVLALALALGIASGLVAGIVPAILASGIDPERALRGSTASLIGGASGRWRDLLTIAQFAAAMSLCIGTGLLVESMHRLLAVEPGFDPTGVLSLRISFPKDRYPEPSHRTAVLSNVLDRLASLPDVDSAAAASWMPMTGSWAKAQMSTEDVTGSAQERSRWPIVLAVSPGFFRALGIPLVAGEDVAARSAADAPPRVVVNRALAERAWPGASPIGRHIKYGGPGSGSPWLEVAGVVANARLVGLALEGEEAMFHPLLPLSFDYPGARLVVRSTTSFDRLSSEVRSAIHEIDDEIPVDGVAGLDELLSKSVAPRRFYLSLLSAFAALSVALAALGVYGVTANWLAARRREIGLRVALGADPWRVAWLVASRGVALVALGLASGVVASYALSHFLASMLYEVRPSDPATFVVAAVVLGSVGTVAAWIPSRHAATTDPSVTLKMD